MQDALRQLADEHMRLSTFLEKWDAQHSGEPAATRARLKTECVVVLTENHGHFVLDGLDIVAFMRERRDKLAGELKQYTVLGQKLPQQ